MRRCMRHDEAVMRQRVAAKMQSFAEARMPAAPPRDDVPHCRDAQHVYVDFAFSMRPVARHGRGA